MKYRQICAIILFFAYMGEISCTSAQSEQWGTPYPTPGFQSLQPKRTSVVAPGRPCFAGQSFFSPCHYYLPN